jgi:hypothetical protein
MVLIEMENRAVGRTGNKNTLITLGGASAHAITAERRCV